jgi:NADH-quinone oxidoreductase subunit N
MNTVIAATEHIKGPHIDYAGLSPLLAPLGGALIVLLVALFPGRFVQRALVPFLTVASLLAGIGLVIWRWDPADTAPIVSGALAADTLGYAVAVLVFVAGIATVLLSVRSQLADEVGHGELYALLLGSITGMVLLASAENLITLFIGFELLSIPLYVLCGARVREEKSLEAGLKYLIIGSVGSATLLYGLALIYGASGSTDFSKISDSISSSGVLGDPLLLSGIALAATGLAFKASVAPFHQWTPDVYEGAPTPITTFMAVTTKVAAFAIFLRFFAGALGFEQTDWAPALAALATITIVIGNAGAVAQRSLKRLLAWSSVAQAGYLLAGVVVNSRLGLQATMFYLAIYLLMNLACFAVVIARENVDERGDDLDAFEGLGRASPWLAWPMTIGMLSLAGFPATGGFIGKFSLINATVNGDYTWLGVVIVVGSAVSLAYYLRVIAVMWMGSITIDIPGPARRAVARVSGWSPEADASAQPEIVFVAVLAAAATIFFGLYPDPLFDVARDVGAALSGVL